MGKVEEYNITLPTEGNVTIRMAVYENGKLAIRIFDGLGFAPLTTLSRNLPEYVNILDDDEFFCKDCDENQQIAKELLDSPLFENTGKFCKPDNSFIAFPVWKFIKS